MYLPGLTTFSLLSSIMIPFVSCALAATTYTTTNLERNTGISTRDVLKSRYNTPHSLEDNDRSSFDPRDGWQAVNVSNLSYKYNSKKKHPRSFRSHHAPHGRPPASPGKKTAHARPHSVNSTHKAGPTGNNTQANSSFSGTVKHVIQDAWKGLTAIGSPESVVITWYTGKDLENPSCWDTSAWTPTDTSFVAALTLEGWTSKPACFSFIELCNGPKTCVFVRVVDSCAGCAKGSKHVDLTKSAFRSLAEPAEGILTVQMRMASEPQNWFVDLWGPKEKLNE